MLSFVQLGYSWELSRVDCSSWPWIAVFVFFDSMCFGDFLVFISLLYMAMEAWLPPLAQMLC
jgi:hypothetical protein